MRIAKIAITSIAAASLPTATLGVALTSYRAAGTLLLGGLLTAVAVGLVALVRLADKTTR